MQKLQKLQSTKIFGQSRTFFSFFCSHATKFFSFFATQSHGINSIINIRNDHNNKQAINSILKSKINMEWKKLQFFSPIAQKAQKVSSGYFRYHTWSQVSYPGVRYHILESGIISWSGYHQKKSKSAKSFEWIPSKKTLLYCLAEKNFINPLFFYFKSTSASWICFLIRSKIVVYHWSNREILS